MIVTNTKLMVLDILQRRNQGEPPIHTVAEAVYWIRTRLGLNPRSMALRLNVSHTTIGRLETGSIKRGSATLLSRLSMEAARINMDNCAEFLESQALIAESEFRRIGGRR